jgi:hypothetical protein
MPCSTNGKKTAYRILVEKPEGRRPLGRPTRRWDDTIMMCIPVTRQKLGKQMSPQYIRLNNKRLFSKWSYRDHL